LNRKQLLRERAVKASTIIAFKFAQNPAEDLDMLYPTTALGTGIRLNDYARTLRLAARPARR
jgi:hypothetical protein